MKRRKVLAVAAGAFGVGLAGCEQRQVSTGPDILEDPPDGVYVPTHTDEMVHVATTSNGRLRFALSYARPHRFWLVTGTRTRGVEVEDDDAIHLMLTVWDEETGVGLPASNATVLLTRNNEPVLEKSLWSMISQQMGIHFGDNIALEQDGTYTVDLEYGPIESRLGGALANLDPGQRTVSFDLEYRQSAVMDLGFEELGNSAGQEDAIGPMEMGMMPVYQLPAIEDLPDHVLGSESSGGMRIGATVLDAPPAGVDGDGPYLAISPRTPYNRYPLPFTSFSTGTGGNTPLAATIDDELGLHYGRVLDRDIDEVHLTPDAPPQLSRHEGYETTFLEMDPVTIGGTSA